MIKRKIQGTVVSDKMNKTRVIEITRLKKHTKYEKYFKVSKRFKAHDENNTYKTGDLVILQECKPYSADKRWRIIGKVIQKNTKVEEPKEEVNEITT